MPLTLTDKQLQQMGLVSGVGNQAKSPARGGGKDKGKGKGAGGGRTAGRQPSVKRSFMAEVEWVCCSTVYDDGTLCPGKWF